MKRAAWLPALLILVAALAVAGRAAPPAPTKSPDLSKATFVDLTHPFDANTIYWPTSPTTFSLKELSRGQTPGGWFYSANTICAPEHGGTHLDAPYHFAAAGQTADAIPLKRLVAAAVVLDIAKAAEADPGYTLRPEDIQRWEQKFGPIPEGAIVLLRTRWSSRWPDRKRYLGDDTPGDASRLNFPSYGEAAAKVLVEQRHVAALGVDTASIDAGSSKDFRVHRVAAAANVPGLENLTNLDQLPEIGLWVAALPMKIAGGSGGPLRAIAILN
jgi:kynurenine formamidase